MAKLAPALAREPEPETDEALAQSLSTDVTTVTYPRREQFALRSQLLAGRAQAFCMMCGRELPAELLIAAHIEPRRRLDDNERQQLHDIAMHARTLGCDANVRARVRAPSPSPEVQKQVATIAGRSCLAFSARSADRFAAHLSTHVRCAGQGLTDRTA
jgi:hypothetical protein